MGSTALKLGALVTVVLAIILAALGFRVAHRYAEQAEQAVASAPPVEAQKLAVVAVAPIPALEPIAADQVALVPVHALPPDYFVATEEVVGRVPMVDIDVGAPITPRYFAEGNLLARLIPDGHKAVSVPVDNVVAVGGFLRPGDIVDVLVYVRGSAQTGEAQARMLMEGLRVLAYENRIIDRPEGLEETPDGSRRRRERTAVLAVPDDQTTRFVLGARLGEITLAMHGQRPQGEAPSGLPLSDQLRARQREAMVPDNAVTATRLLRVEPPPAERKRKPPPKPKITVHRGDSIEEVSP